MMERDNGRWECAECGEFNSREMILCSCGYMDDDLFQDEEPATHIEPVMVKQNDQRKTIPRPTAYIRKRSSIFDGWFTLSTWKDGYGRWMLLLFIAIFYYRGTVDGLLFIAFLAIKAASRLESLKRYGAPVITGKRKDQSIWDYGLGRTVVAVFLPSCLPEVSRTYWPVYSTIGAYEFIGGAIVTSLILHLYIGVVILFDYVDAEATRQALFVTNQPFTVLLQYWPSYTGTIEKLVLHGYENRVQIISHVYIVAAIGCLVYGAYCLLFLLRLDSLEVFFNEKRDYMLNYRSLSRSAVLERFIKWPPGGWFVRVIGTACFVTVIVYACSLPLHFPGDPHPRHGKYIWLYSYAYIDNLGFFTIAYLLPLMVFMLYLVLTFVYEPFYRVGLRCVRK